MNIVYLLSALRGLAMGLFAPVWILNLAERGFDLLEIGLFGTLFEIAKLLFEVPTGMFVDKYGIKRGILGSFFCSVITWGLFPFMQSAVLLMAVMILWALAEALVSGTFETWISRVVQEGHFGKAMMRNTRIMIVTIIVGSISSGILYRHRSFLPFLLVVGTYAVLLLLTFLLPHVPARIGQQSEQATYRQMIGNSLRIVIGHRRVALIVVAGFFSAMTYDAIARYWQPYLHGYGFDAQMLGYVMAVSGVIAFFLLTFTVRASHLIGKHTLLSLTVVEGTGMMLILANVIGLKPLRIIATPVLLAVEDIRNPIVDSYLNKFFPDSYKATLFSINAGVGAAGEILSGVVFGLLAARFGLVITFLAAATGLIPSILIYRVVPQMKEPASGASALDIVGGS